MHRSHNCGELSESNLNQEVTLAGWVQKIRNKGFIAWIDLRDRYGITQLVFDETRTPKAVFKKSTRLCTRHNHCDCPLIYLFIYSLSWYRFVN